MQCGWAIFAGPVYFIVVVVVVSRLLRPMSHYHIQEKADAAIVGRLHVHPPNGSKQQSFAKKGKKKKHNLHNSKKMKLLITAWALCDITVVHFVWSLFRSGVAH